jgi:hypothetical protein
MAVARSRQVYIEWLEAAILSIYLEDIYMYIRPTLQPEAALTPEATFAT